MCHTSKYHTSALFEQLEALDYPSMWVIHQQLIQSNTKYRVAQGFMIASVLNWKFPSGCLLYSNENRINLVTTYLSPIGLTLEALIGIKTRAIQWLCQVFQEKQSETIGYFIATILRWKKPPKFLFLAEDEITCMVCDNTTLGISSNPADFNSSAKEIISCPSTQSDNFNMVKNTEMSLTKIVSTSSINSEICSFKQHNCVLSSNSNEELHKKLFSCCAVESDLDNSVNTKKNSSTQVTSSIASATSESKNVVSLKNGEDEDIILRELTANEVESTLNSTTDCLSNDSILPVVSERITITSNTSGRCIYTKNESVEESVLLLTPAEYKCTPKSKITAENEVNSNEWSNDALNTASHVPMKLSEIPWDFPSAQLAAEDDCCVCQFNPIIVRINGENSPSAIKEKVYEDNKNANFSSKIEKLDMVADFTGIHSCKDNIRVEDDKLYLEQTKTIQDVVTKANCMVETNKNQDNTEDRLDSNKGHKFFSCFELKSTETNSVTKVSDNSIADISCEALQPYITSGIENSKTFIQTENPCNQATVEHDSKLEIYAENNEKVATIDLNNANWPHTINGNVQKENSSFSSHISGEFLPSECTNTTREREYSNSSTCEETITDYCIILKTNVQDIYALSNMKLSDNTCGSGDKIMEDSTQEEIYAHIHNKVLENKDLKHNTEEANCIAEDCISKEKFKDNIPCEDSTACHDQPQHIHNCDGQPQLHTNRDNSKELLIVKKVNANESDSNMTDRSHLSDGDLKMASVIRIMSSVLAWEFRSLQPRDRAQCQDRLFFVGNDDNFLDASTKLSSAAPLCDATDTPQSELQTTQNQGKETINRLKYERKRHGNQLDSSLWVKPSGICNSPRLEVKTSGFSSELNGMKVHLQSCGTELKRKDFDIASDLVLKKQFKNITANKLSHKIANRSKILAEGDRKYFHSTAKVQECYSKHRISDRVLADFEDIRAKEISKSNGSKNSTKLHKDCLIHTLNKCWALVHQLHLRITDNKCKNPSVSDDEDCNKLLYTQEDFDLLFNLVWKELSHVMGHSLLYLQSDTLVPKWEILNREMPDSCFIVSRIFLECLKKQIQLVNNKFIKMKMLKNIIHNPNKVDLKSVMVTLERVIDRRVKIDPTSIVQERRTLYDKEIKHLTTESAQILIELKYLIDQYRNYLDILLDHSNRTALHEDIPMECASLLVGRNVSKFTFGLRLKPDIINNKLEERQENMSKNENRGISSRTIFRCRSRIGTAFEFVRSKTMELSVLKNRTCSKNILKMNSFIKCCVSPYPPREVILLRAKHYYTQVTRSEKNNRPITMWASECVPIKRHPRYHPYRHKTSDDSNSS